MDLVDLGQLHDLSDGDSLALVAQSEPTQSWNILRTAGGRGDGGCGGLGGLGINGQKSDGVTAGRRTGCTHAHGGGEQAHLEGLNADGLADGDAAHADAALLYEPATEV